MVACLEALDVEHVFGIVSVHNLPIYDAIERRRSIQPVSVRHEQGAVHAADGYARATGKLGVATTSTGPGAANAVPGLYEASFASSPVLMITGQVESSSYGKGRGALHEAERQLPMLRAVTRRAETVWQTEHIGSVITSVAEDICTGRPQPGAVEIPIDLQYKEAHVEIATPRSLRMEPDLAAIEAAARLLSEAKQTFIWAGGGVLRAGATDALVALAERLAAPVATSMQGRGAIPEDHPLALGATTNMPEVGALVDQADVVLAVGTRFQGNATRNWSVGIRGSLVHLDADPGVIGRVYPPAVSIVADARLGLEALLARIDGSERDGSFAERAAGEAKQIRQSARDRLGPDHVLIMDTIRSLLPPDGPVVRDATMPAYLWGDWLLPILCPRTSIAPTSMAIGPGLPLAIGAAIGSGRPTVVVQGDGGLMLSLGELATAVQYQLPVIVCVFNDRGYGVIRSIQEGVFGRVVGVDLATPDFAALAQAMGARGETVSVVKAFPPAFERALAAAGPTVLDIDMKSLAVPRVG